MKREVIAVLDATNVLSVGNNDYTVASGAAFERLPPEKRDLLIMTRIRGWGYAKIAAECGATEGAIRVLVHRAMQELKLVERSRIRSIPSPPGPSLGSLATDCRVATASNTPPVPPVLRATA